MGNSKINAVSNLLKFKCKHRLLEWEYEMLKNHKIQLYTFRYDFITSMKITENMLYYFKFKIKGINITEQAKQNLDKDLSAMKFVSYLTSISIYLLDIRYNITCCLLDLFKNKRKSKSEIK